jgi:site-specific DNA-methyltransferase (adenine-specific)
MLWFRAKIRKKFSLTRRREMLYNEDCLQVINRIPDESIDLVVTDCPYHIVSGGCTNDKVKIGRSEKSEFDEWCYTKDGKLFKHNDIEFKDWLPEIYRVLKQGTHCYVMINARNLKDLQTEAEKTGFVFQNLLVWDKGNLTPNRYYMGAYELILMLRKGKARKINGMGTSNILRVPNITRTKEHPTEKPKDLMKILIANSSNEGDTVLDPFMGVGGTGLACKELNREFIGIEIDEKYFNIADERMKEEYEQLTIFDFI